MDRRRRLATAETEPYMVEETPKVIRLHVQGCNVSEDCRNCKFYGITYWIRKVNYLQAEAEIDCSLRKETNLRRGMRII